LDHFKRNGKWVGERINEFNKKHGIKRGWLEFIEELDGPDLSDIPNPKPRYTRRELYTRNNKPNDKDCINPVFNPNSSYNRPDFNYPLKKQSFKKMKGSKMNKRRKLPMVLDKQNKKVTTFKTRVAQMDLFMTHNLRNVYPSQKAVSCFKKDINI
jgi:hypothetical protein